MFSSVPGQKRHTRTVALLLLVVLGSACYSFLHRTSAPKHDRFLLVFLWELNSHLGSRTSDAPAAQWAQRFWGSSSLPFDWEQRQLFVDEEGQGPDAAHPYLLIYQLDGLLNTVFRRDIPFSTLPSHWTLPLNVSGNIPMKHLLRARGTLVLEELLPDGTLRVAWQGESFTLPPGEGWARAWISGESSEDVTEVDAVGQWEEQLLSALQSDRQVELIRLYNLGWWRHDQVVDRR